MPARDANVTRGGSGHDLTPASFRSSKMPQPSPASSAAYRVTARGPRPLASYLNAAGIIAIHVAAVVALVRGATTGLVLLAAGSYLVRMFAITGVYHRYFAHRSYRTSRAFQLVLAFLGTTATQKGPLWWASTHRVHHRYSDTEKDVHSPLRRGFWYSHMGWWLSREHEKTPMALIPDYAGYPELRWLDRHHVVGPTFLITLCWLVAGADGILWGFALSTCLLMHATFTINSLAHVFGSRRYATTDTSRNNFLLALITLGEGWHNNHHHYMSSANQGFFWWEIDISYYVLKTFEAVGLVHDVRRPPARWLTKDLIADVGERAPLLLAQDDAPPVVVTTSAAEVAAES
jgi:stearoyl-CoA desaturase (Delta-9 desaturase)